MHTLHTQMARRIHHLSSSYLAVSITTLFSGLRCFVRLMVWSEIFHTKCLLWDNFVVVQPKELRCFQEHSLPQIRPSVSFPEWILKVDLCRAQCGESNGAQSMNHRYQELCIQDGKNTTCWVSTSGPRALWSWLLFGHSVDPVENPTHAPQRGTLRSVLGEVLSLVLTASSRLQRYIQAHSPWSWPPWISWAVLAMRSLLLGAVFFYFVENWIALVRLKTLHLVCPTRLCICHQSDTPVPPTTTTSLPVRIVAQICSYSGTMRSRRNVCSDKKSQWRTALQL